jgi:hypothetical protein
MQDDRDNSRESPSTPEAVRAELQRRIAELARQGKELDRQDRRLSTARGLTFLLAAGGALTAAFQDASWLWLAVGVVAAGFVAFVVLHALVSSRQFETARRREMIDQGLARMAGTFRAPTKGRERVRGDRFIDPEHDYASDLDLFGPGSVFEQLNTCRTWPGESQLAAWLLRPASAAEVAARQRAVRELCRHGALREDLALEAGQASGTESDTAPAVRWAQGPAEAAVLRSKLVGAFAAASVAATVGLATLHAAGGPAFSQLWLVLLAVQLAVVLLLRRQLEPVIGPICERSQPLGRYHRVFALLERARFRDDRLEGLHERLRGATGRTASQELRRLESLVSFAAVRHNAFVYIPANALLLWDLWCARALERWRARCGADLEGWLEALGELEALSALATFAYEHPEYAFPEVLRGAPQLRARALGHPLIRPDRRVDNDVELGADPAAWMVSGSNMSGKSTFLRAVGVNAVLAQAGAPVCAASHEQSELAVHTCMRVDDSLEEGISRFYRELLKLKRVMDGLGAEGPPVLFLLDEILHGTNSRERNIGGRAIVRQLVEAGAVGLVSSHDLGLTSLEELTGRQVQNAHFTDQLVEGEMRFDYRLRPGPVATPNALRLMRKVGLPVDADGEANPVDGDPGRG